MDALADVATRFRIDGAIENIQAIEAGHINDTYVVETSAPQRYVLQRINHHVFRDPRGLMQNVSLVTAHLREQLEAEGERDSHRRVMTVIPTIDGDPVCEWGDGTFWRVSPFIERTHTVGVEATLEEVYQAGLGFGQFVAGLIDLPTSELCETIPKFHHGTSRYKAFQHAVATDVAQRTIECETEIATVEQYAELLAWPQSQVDSGELPLRVTHNDTKCNNILLGDESNAAVCVIDLDTVMPGLAMWDFGDLVRTSACRAAEDEVDLSLVKVEKDRLLEAARGYMQGCGNVLTAAELRSLAVGPCYMALIMATRFLTDYLQGDTYYKVLHPRHNLDRCRNQLALLAELEKQQPALQRLFADAIG